MEGLVSVVLRLAPEPQHSGDGLKSSDPPGPLLPPKNQVSGEMAMDAAQGLHASCHSAATCRQPSWVLTLHTVTCTPFQTG